MALAPLNKSRRVQVSEYRAQGDTDRAILQYENPRPRTSMRAPSSLLFAKASAFQRFSLPEPPLSVASSKRFSSWWHALKKYYKSVSCFSFGAAELEAERFIQSSGPKTYAQGVELESKCVDWSQVRRFLLLWGLKERYEEDRRFDDPWFNIVASESLDEEVWTLNGSWGPELWIEVRQFARPFHLRLARVFEYKSKIGSVVSHKMHAHPDGVLTPENTNDDVELLSDYLMDKALVRRWKAGSGRKKDWRTAPHPKFTNQDRKRLLRFSQQKDATFHSCSTLVQSSRFISLMNQASLSSGVPLVMFEHGMAGQNGSRNHPKPSLLKNTIRQFGSFTSITGRSRTRSKPFPPKAVRFAAGVIVEGDDGVDDEENYLYSFEPGPLDGYVKGDLFSDMGNDISKNNLPRCGSRGRRSKLQSLTHLIAYESFIGSCLGRSFRLKGIIRAESCYHLYALEPLFETSQTYEARAYEFQGLKPNDLKYRRRNFKRCKGNRFCEQSLEQGGKKWVVSRCVTNSKIESEIPPTVVSEQQDQAKGLTKHPIPNNTSNITEESTEASQAARPSRIPLRADSAQIFPLSSRNLGENDAPVVARGSAVAPSFSHSANGQERLISVSPHHGERVDAGLTSGYRKPKSPEQLKRKRERWRRAQQIRRLMKSEQQNKERILRVLQLKKRVKGDYFYIPTYEELSFLRELRGRGAIGGLGDIELLKLAKEALSI